MDLETEETDGATNSSLGNADRRTADTGDSQSLSLIEAYQQSGIDIRRYLTRVLVPIGAVDALLLAGWIGFGLSAVIAVPVAALLVLLTSTAVLYPKIAVDRRRVEMERRFHLFLTHLTVLSLTEINRVAVVDELSDHRGEYKSLAGEASQIVTIVNIWNQSLDDAFRRRSKAVPSDQVRDLFERLAYTLGTGRELRDFLIEEQDLIMSQYQTTYRQSVRNIKLFVNLYQGMILAVTFGLVFTIVIPVITGHDPILLVLTVVIVFALVQLGFYFFIRSLVPYDPLWYRGSDDNSKNKTTRRLRLVGVASAVVSTGLFSVLIIGDNTFPGALSGVPGELYPAVAVTPLTLPGLLYYREQCRIRRRDDEFPSFIRALGSSETIRQSTTSGVLGSLSHKDFGPLTDPVMGLHRRLRLRLAVDKAWERFAAETNSYLIQKFSDMYTVGRRLGGDPKQLGEAVGENMSMINELRNERSQEVKTLIGVLYGLSIASAFAFFAGLEIVMLITDLDIGVDGARQANMTQMISADQYDIPFLRTVLLGLVSYNALLSGLTIKQAGGGSGGASLVHVVGLLWVSCLTAFITTVVVNTFI